MTIFRAGWFLEFNYLTSRLAVAHGDLTVIVALLRNGSVEVWSVVVGGSDGKGTVDDWRRGYAAERQRMVDFLATNRARATTESSIVVTAMDGYIAAIANMKPAFDTIRATWINTDGHVVMKPLDQADRDTLANAIEDGLEV